MLLTLRYDGVAFEGVSMPELIPSAEESIAVTVEKVWLERDQSGTADVLLEYSARDLVV